MRMLTRQRFESKPHLFNPLPPGQAGMKLQTLRADRREAEAEVRDARLETAVLGLSRAEAHEGETQARAQREALREARLGLDAAAATTVFASVPHSGAGPTEGVCLFHSQLLAAAAQEPGGLGLEIQPRGGRDVSVHAEWAAAWPPATGAGGGEERELGAARAGVQEEDDERDAGARAELEAMRGMGQDALARDVTLSRAGGAVRWRCVFTTRRSSSSLLALQVLKGP